MDKIWRIARRKLDNEPNTLKKSFLFKKAVINLM